jgi:Flp pilus assembly protein TadG
MLVQRPSTRLKTRLKTPGPCPAGRHTSERRASERRASRRRGAALVEVALVLPIFIMVTLGIIEFGRAMMVSQLVTNAAREGAREAIIQGKTNTQVCAGITSFLSQSVNIAADQVEITITVTPDVGNPDAGNEVANATAGDLVQVRVEVPFDQVSLTKAKYLGGKNLVGIAAMRHE